MDQAKQVDAFNKNAILAAALSYANRGWPVFPVHYPLKTGICSCRNLACKGVGKHPRTKNGVKDATTDIRIINGWINIFGLFNLGISTSEFFVLDEDPRHGGSESRCDLEQKFGRLPHTVTSLTGGNGCHYCFLNPDFKVKNRVGLLPGLDIRGMGGYIVAPPSLHRTGSIYCFDYGFSPDEVEMASAPVWLQSMLSPDATFKSVPSYANAVLESKVQEGSRNETLASFAGYLLRRYVEPHIVLDLMVAWNRAKCEPPLCMDEVIKLVNSIAGREVARRQRKNCQ